MLEKKILSPARLSAVLKKQKSKKVVFTNGCFDLLHAGHVTYLEKAKKLGDVLVVALNTDASTARLKGPTRPINPLKDRAIVIAALESVDYVTWFGTDTPLSLIQKLLPQVLVKGGDYEIKNIVGFDEVIRAGGKVKTISFLKGRSTTLMVKRASSPFEK